MQGYPSILLSEDSSSFADIFPVLTVPAEVLIEGCLHTPGVLFILSLKVVDSFDGVVIASACTDLPSLLFLFPLAFLLEELQEVISDLIGFILFLCPITVFGLNISFVDLFRMFFIVLILFLLLLLDLHDVLGVFVFFALALLSITFALLFIDDLFVPEKLLLVLRHLDSVLDFLLLA